MVIYSCHRYGKMECWNIGILGIKAENYLNGQKIL